MVLFEQEYLRINFDEEHRFIHQKWKGFANSEKFRDGIDFFNRKLREHNVYKVIIDVSEQQSPYKSDMDYASQSINEFAASCSELVHCAFVMPKSAILQVALRFFGKSIMGIKGVDVKFVKTEEEALDWMKKI